MRIGASTVFLLLVVACGGSRNSDEPNMLINGIDVDFEPFAYLDVMGEPDGFDVKAVEWIAAEMGFRSTS